jgi:hypothetical protein
MNKDYTALQLEIVQINQEEPQTPKKVVTEISTARCFRLVRCVVDAHRNLLLNI